MLPQEKMSSLAETSRDVVLLRQAAAAYKAGDKDQARLLLAEASRINPDNELVWLWRASVAASATEAREAVEHVLELNPKNPKALQWKAKLDARRARPAQGPVPVAKPKPAAAPPEPKSDDADPIRAILSEKLTSIRPLPTGASAEETTPPEDMRKSMILNEPYRPGSAVAAVAAQPAKAPESEHGAAQGAVEAPTASTPSSGSTEAQRSCPICETILDKSVVPCPRCRCVVDLELCDEMSQHDGADRAMLQAGVAKLESKAGAGEGDFETFRALAVGYLNLKRSNDAVKALVEASRLNPSNRLVSDTLERLNLRKLVLAVDDSATIQRMIASVLERRLYRVVTANDGMQALARLNEELPNIVLLDITMPRMDGYQVCKVITGNPETQHIPVIMLSGKDGFFDKVRGRMAGATDYVTKPFTAEQLTAALEKRVTK